MRITIAADDLPELWEEYVAKIENIGFKMFPPPLEEKIQIITNWLFGGKEEEDDRGNSGRG